MPRECFEELCDKIKEVVGEEEFKSEKYLEGLLALGNATRKSCTYNSSILFNGVYVPGEIKVAMTLRILAGASYLDMFLWFNVCADHVLVITRKVMREWFCNDEVMEIDFYKSILQDQVFRKDVMDDFASRSGGVLQGCIGALDGWLVRIMCPSIFEVKNPGKYYSRKGFYAINVQAIVDKKKRILWRYIGEGECPRLFCL